MKSAAPKGFVSPTQRDRRQRSIPSLPAVAEGLYLNRRVNRLGVVWWDFSRRLTAAGLRLRRVRLFLNSVIFMRLLARAAAPIQSSKRSRPSARQRFIPRLRNSLEVHPSRF
jgi:hypothetical protein